MSYILKNKKLYEGENEIRIDLANLDQIKFIKRKEKLAKQYVKGFSIGGHQKQIKINFECICSDNMLSFNYDDDNDDCYDDYDYESFTHNTKCRICKRVYRLEENDESELIIKLD